MAGTGQAQRRGHLAGGAGGHWRRRCRRGSTSCGSWRERLGTLELTPSAAGLEALRLLLLPAAGPGSARAASADGFGRCPGGSTVSATSAPHCCSSRYSAAGAPCGELGGWRRRGWSASAGSGPPPPVAASCATPRRWWSRCCRCHAGSCPPLLPPACCSATGPVARAAELAAPTSVGDTAEVEDACCWRAADGSASSSPSGSSRQVANESDTPAICSRVATGLVHFLRRRRRLPPAKQLQKRTRPAAAPPRAPPRCQCCCCCWQQSRGGCRAVMLRGCFAVHQLHLLDTPKPAVSVLA